MLFVYVECYVVHALRTNQHATAGILLHRQGNLRHHCRDAFRTKRTIIVYLLVLIHNQLLLQHLPPPLRSRVTAAKPPWPLHQTPNSGNFTTLLIT